MAQKFAILLLTVAGVFAGPLRPEETTTQCAVTCPDTSKFDYTPGSTYRYKYESDLKSNIGEASEEHSSLHMSTTVQVEVLSKCEFVLKLSDVTLADSNPSAYERRNPVQGAWEFKRAMQEKPLRFAYLDGEVHSLCPEEEPTWVLNIKRAILSSFQNTQPDLRVNTQLVETDVTGTCTVSYEPQDSYGMFRIKKTKDLLGCTEGHSYQSAFQGTPYTAHSRIQSLPIMRSTHECTQEVTSEGVLTSTECTEMHIFRPFSQHHSGAMTTVNTKLTFHSKIAGIRTRIETIPGRASLLFEFETTPEEDTRVNMQQAVSTLQSLCQMTDVRPETPAQFQTLISHMRAMSPEQLTQLFSRTKTICDKASKFFRDALPMLGTSGAVSLIRDLVSRGDVTGTEADIWLTSMAFIPTPTIEMLRETIPMLKMSNRKVALAVSSLVHTYCRINSDCGEETIVRQIIRVFEDNLNYNCKSRGDKDQVMMALKALGNMGHAETVVPALNECFKTKDNPTEVRLAAIDAFRRMTCTAEKDELITLYTDKMVDAELRIHAYLMIMQCPTTAILDIVKSTLQREEVNQVGSFVWTHLTNLQTTSSPLKQELREILEDITLKKTFALDARKFSRNIEWSTFFDSINMGAEIESNLIWSPKSFVPRSANLNLTMDVFGRSMNLVEVGGRVEGVEQLLEKVFAEHKYTDNEVVREKRAIIEEDAINTIDQRFKVDAEDHPKGSYYLKIFGNEIRYDDFEGLDLDAMKEKFNYLNWLIELAKEHQFDMTKSIMFLDTSMIYPTAAGFPLKLSAIGTTVMDLKVQGKLDIRKIKSPPRTIDIVGSVRPSAATQITCKMTVDAFVATAGLSMVSTVHTSTVTDGKLQLLDGKVFNFDINMPNDKMEIFSAENKFFIIHRSDMKEQRMIQEGRIEREICSPSSLVRTIGLELCGAVSLPNHPMAGPASVSIVLHKRDTYSGFHFETSYDVEKVRNSAGIVYNYKAKMVSNTPGSRYDREFTMDFLLDRANQAARLNLRSPWKKADLSTSYVSRPDLMRFQAGAIIDDASEYSIRAETQIDEKRILTTYTPNVEVKIHGRDPITLTGQVKYKEKRSFEIDLRLDNAFDNRMTFGGEISKINNKKRTKYEGEIEVKSSKFNGKFGGYYDIQRAEGTTYVTRIEGEYNMPRMKKEKITLNGKLRDMSSGTTRQYNVNGALTMSAWRDMDFNLDFTKPRGAINARLDAGFTGDARHRITVQQTTDFNFHGQDKKMNFVTQLTAPWKNIDYNLQVEHLHNSNQIKSLATARYGPRNEARFDLNVVRESIRPLKAKAEVKMHIPGRRMSLTETIEERNPGEYHQDLLVQLDAYDDVRLNSVYKMEPRHELTATLNLPGFHPMSMRSHLRPELTNFEVHLEGTYERHNYGLDTNWMHRGNPRVFTTTGSATVNTPWRSLTGTTEVNRRGHNLSGKLTTQWETGKTATVSGNVDMTPHAPSFNLDFQAHPRHSIKLSGTGKYDRRGWWHPERDLEGSLSLKTSFPGAEELAFSFKHMSDDGKILTSGEASWAPRQKITMDLNLQKIRGWGQVKKMLTISTPFYGYRRIISDLEYNRQGLTLNTNHKITVERQEGSLVISGRLDPRRHFLDASINMKTPFNGYEDMALSVRHNDNGRTFSSNLQGTWNRRSASANFKMEHTLYGLQLDNSGELSITLPTRDYRTVKLTWAHKKTDSTLKQSIELELPAGKSVINTDASHTVNRRQRTIDFKMSATCPYTSPMSLDFHHEHQMYNWDNIKTSLSGQMMERALTVENEMSIAKTHGIHKFKLITPFRSLRRLTHDMEHTIRGNTLKLKNELNWGYNQKISLDGQWTLDGYTLEGQTRITTPFQELQVINVQASNKEVRRAWTTQASVEYNRNKIEMESQFAWRRQKRVSFEIKTPFHNFRQTELEIEHEGDLRDFETKASFQTDLIRGKYSGEVKLDTQNLKNIEASVDVTTPIRYIRFIKAHATHRASGTRYITDGTLEYPGNKYTVKHDGNPVSWYDYSCTTTITMNDEVIENVVRINGKRNWAINWELKTPYGYIREASANFNHRGNLNSFVTSLESTWNRDPFMSMSLTHRGAFTDFKSDMEATFGRDRFTSNMAFKKEVSSMVASWTMTTPWRYWKNMEFSMNHRGGATNFQNDITLGYSVHKCSANTQFNLGSNSLRLNSVVNTPVPGWEKFTLNVEHSGVPTSFKSSANMDLAGYIGSVAAEFTMERDSVTAMFDLKTPFEVFEGIKVDLTHNGPWYNFKNNVGVTYRRRTYTSLTEFTKRGNTVTGKYEITLPFARVQKISASFNHQGVLTDFRNSAMIEYGYGKIEGASEFMLKGNNVNGKVELKTPYRQLPSVVLSFSHQGVRRNFKNNAKLEIFGREYTAETNFRWIRDNLNLGFEVNTPKTYSFNMKHKGDMSDFRNNMKMMIGRDRLNANTAFKMNRNKMEGSTSIRTPYRGYDNFGGSFTHQGGLSNFKSTAAIETPFEGYTHFSGLLEHRGNMNAFKTTGRLETPFKEVPTVQATINHNGNRNQFASSGILELDDKESKGTVTFRRTREGFNAETNVETPYPGYERFGANANYNGNPGARGGSLEITTPFRGYEKVSMDLNHQSRGAGFNTRANFQSPLAGYERFGVVLNHNGDMGNFQSSGSLRTPFAKMPSIGFNLKHQGGLKDFKSEGSIEYNNKKLEGSVSSKLNHGYGAINHEGTITFTTPYEHLRDLDIKYNYGHDRRHNGNGKLEVTYNGKEVVDGDYNYVWGPEKKLTITTRQPQAATLQTTATIAENSFNGEAFVNWNQRVRDSNVRVQANLKNIVQGPRVNREATFKTIFPRQEYTVMGAYTGEPGKFTQVSEVSWGRDPNSKVSYELELSKEGRRSTSLYNGKFNLISPVASFEVTGNHRATPSLQMTTVTLGNRRPMKVESRITYGRPAYSQTITITHPSMRQPAEIEITLDNQNKKYEGKVTTKYADQEFILSGDLTDESTPRETKYTGAMQLQNRRAFLDMQLRGSAASNARTINVEGEAKYLMTRDRSHKVWSTRMEINKLREQLEMDIVTPVSTIKMRGNRNKDNRECLTSAAIDIDGEEYKADFGLNYKRMSADLQLQAPRQRGLHIYAKYLSPTNFQFETTHTTRGRRIQDALANVRLVDGRLIKFQGFLRPHIMDDIQEATNMVEFDTREWNNLMRGMQDDARYKARSLENAIEPIREASETVSKAYSDATRDMYNSYRRAYYSNDYHVRDIAQWWQRKSAEMSRTMDQLGHSMNQMQHRLSHHMHVLGNKMSDWAASAADKLGGHLTQARQTFSDAHGYVADNFNVGFDFAHETLRDMIERVRHHPKMAPIMHRIRSVTDGDYTRLIDEARAYLHDKFDWANEYYHVAMENPHVRKVVDYLVHALKQTSWYYNYYEVSEKVVELAKDLYNSGLETVRSSLKEMGKRYYDLDKTRITLWEPTHGEVRAELYLPIPMKNLRTMPVFHLRRRIMEIRNTLTGWWPQDEYYLYDLFYTYKPSMDIYNWIPPFKTHAAIMGSQHYMTFDKRFYEFRGECTYLLARDFINGKFGVFVNYENTRRVVTKKSLTVLSGEHQIEISPDFKVMVDGARKDLPLVLDGTTIMRTGNMMRVNNNAGVTVTCDLPHDRCTVNVTGWYYGKTAGLFGTYNNEPMDDFTKIDHTLATDAAEFAQSWVAGRRCRMVNHAQDMLPEPNTRKYEICAKYFLEKESPFRMCFKQVPNEEFLKMCVNDMPMDENRMMTEEDVCNTAAFYVDECERAGVSLRIPSVCVKSEVTAGKILHEGESMTLSAETTPPLRAADVIFVVDHHDCNKETVDKLKFVVDALDKALYRQGMKDTRFGLVGYGGTGDLDAPHSQTMDGEIFNSRDKFLLGLETFEMVEGHAGDALAAIKFAARYPFRAGASKTVILVPCGYCQEGPVTYSEILRLLVTRDIHLHMLMQHDFQLRSKDPKSSFIYGVTKTGLFNLKALKDKELKGDTALRKQVIMPKDICVAITEETDGSVFNVNKLTQGRPVQQKKFTDVMTLVLAKLAEPTECQVCEVVADEVGVGMPVCRSCTMRVIPYTVPSFPDVQINEIKGPVKPKPKPRKGRPKKVSKKQPKFLKNKNKKWKKKRPQE